MFTLTPSASTAPLWTPKLHKWLMGVDAANYVILPLALLFSIANGIQASDNYVNWRGLSVPVADFQGAILTMAIIPPSVCLIWLATQRFLYARRTLPPWAVLTASLVFICGLAVTCFFVLAYGYDATYLYGTSIGGDFVLSTGTDGGYYGGGVEGSVAKRDAAAEAIPIPQQPATTAVPSNTFATSILQSTITYTHTSFTYAYDTVTSTPTQTVISIAKPTQTFITSIPLGEIIMTKPTIYALQRGVPVSRTVFWIRWALLILAGIIQLFYMSVAARAIDVRRKAARAARKATVTYFEPPNVADAHGALSDPPRSEAPTYDTSNATQLPPWSPPRSARGSFESIEVDEKKAAVMAESLK